MLSFIPTTYKRTSWNGGVQNGLRFVWNGEQSRRADALCSSISALSTSVRPLHLFASIRLPSLPLTLSSTMPLIANSPSFLCDAAPEPQLPSAHPRPTRSPLSSPLPLLARASSQGGKHHLPSFPSLFFLLFSFVLGLLCVN